MIGVAVNRVRLDYPDGGPGGPAELSRLKETLRPSVWAHHPI